MNQKSNFHSILKTAKSCKYALQTIEVIAVWLLALVALVKRNRTWASIERRQVQLTQELHTQNKLPNARDNRTF